MVSNQVKTVVDVKLRPEEMPLDVYFIREAVVKYGAELDERVYKYLKRCLIRGKGPEREVAAVTLATAAFTSAATLLREFIAEDDVNTEVKRTILYKAYEALCAGTTRPYDALPVFYSALTGKDMTVKAAAKALLARAYIETGGDIRHEIFANLLDLVFIN